MPEIGEIKKGTEIGFKSPHKYIYQACRECRKKRWVAIYVYNGKPKSLRCKTCAARISMSRLSKSQCGDKHPNWKGGQFVASNGYVYIYKSDHPKASKRNYIKRATIVLEQKLGRPIRKGYVSHHKNELKTDDRPENLEEMQAKRHRIYHKLEPIWQNEMSLITKWCIANGYELIYGGERCLAS